jgi:hypothetical protein
VEVITPSPSIRNDAYEVELNLPPGVYYLAIPSQGATGNSTLSGCFGNYGVFSYGIGFKH